MIKGEHASCVSVIKRWLEGVAARGAQCGTDVVHNVVHNVAHKLVHNVVHNVVHNPEKIPPSRLDQPAPQAFL